MTPIEPTAKRQKLSPPDDKITDAPPPPDPLKGSPTQNVSSPRSSWYSRTWPRKAAPITQVARESISSASNTAIETASAVRDKVAPPPSRRSSLALTLGKTKSNKSLPVNATITKDHAMPAARKESKSSGTLTATTEELHTENETANTSNVPAGQSQADASTAEPLAQPTPEQLKDTNQADTNAAPRSWIAWLARSDNTPGTTPTAVQTREGTPAPDKSDTPNRSNARSAAEDQSRLNTSNETSEDTCLAGSATVGETPKDGTATYRPNNQRLSWLPIWSNAAATQSAPVLSPPAQEPNIKASAQSTENSNPSAQPNTNVTRVPNESTVDAQSFNPAQPGTKPSAWAFWSRDKPTETRSLKDVLREGELAVANTASENRPRRASLDVKDIAKPGSVTSNASAPLTSKVDLKARHKSKDSKGTQESAPETAAGVTKAKSKDASATAIAPTEQKTLRPASPAPSKKAYEHQLLPLLHETLKLPENPTLLQQLAKLFYSAKEPDLKHLSLVKDPPRVKNVLAIGVHGYFPAPLIRSVLGQPTGTSIKFADMAAKCIRRWTKKRGYECHVKTVALEGEGKIADRVDLLWKLLLNWIEETRKADFVMVACHSQGVPVAIMLVAKLIHFGCITSARVGICAMAGVNMGPFPELKSRWISGSSAGELFEFSDPASKVSQDYLAALEEVLKFGVRVIYTGSIDDQLVSLESSVFAPISHPHIYRAVSIDSRIHAPDFVSHLVAFALKLRNLGVQDHGLIRELSVPLAGSLYSGEGHSRLYEDDNIYDLACSFALETTSMLGVPLAQRNVSTTASNPFILPFAMRGMLEEDHVKSDLQEEASQLLEQFDEWKPTTKALKDVKFRLEGIRSKL